MAASPPALLSFEMLPEGACFLWWSFLFLLEARMMDDSRRPLGGTS